MESAVREMSLNAGHRRRVLNQNFNRNRSSKSRTTCSTGFCSATAAPLSVDDIPTIRHGCVAAGYCAVVDLYDMAWEE